MARMRPIEAPPNTPYARDTSVNGSRFFQQLRHRTIQRSRETNQNRHARVPKDNGSRRPPILFSAARPRYGWPAGLSAFSRLSISRSSTPKTRSHADQRGAQQPSQQCDQKDSARLGAAGLTAFAPTRCRSARIQSPRGPTTLIFFFLFCLTTYMRAVRFAEQLVGVRAVRPGRASVRC